MSVRCQRRGGDEVGTTTWISEFLNSEERLSRVSRHAVVRGGGGVGPGGSVKWSSVAEEREEERKDWTGH
ncbi:hypothetical protein Droror1_Dr00004797 [Drosera rotundifolia]